MTDRRKAAGPILQTLTFLAAAIPMFYVGLFVALIPCLDDVPGPYCSVHGGYGIFVGWASGLALGVTSGVASVRWVTRSLAEENRPETKHEA
jgi:hypothetical protein